MEDHPDGLAVDLDHEQGAKSALVFDPREGQPADPLHGFPNRCRVESVLVPKLFGRSGTDPEFVDFQVSHGPEPTAGASN